MTNISNSLLDVACAARSCAYAPYSGFKVGAALLTASGRVFAGANVENISLGLTICAERGSVGAAVAAGEVAFEHLVILTDSEEPTVPCGACRQVLSEFSPELLVTSLTLGGAKQQFTVADLLPSPRQGIDVPRRT